MTRKTILEFINIPEGLRCGSSDTKTAKVHLSLTDDGNSRTASAGRKWKKCYYSSGGRGDPTDDDLEESGWVFC
jgi:hypothetical protein